MSAEYISAALDLDVTGPDHTRRLALTLAQHLNAGDVLLLSGELGAGKTTFTRSLGEGLGVREGVISPTFVLSRVHPNLPDGPAPAAPTWCTWTPTASPVPKSSTTWTWSSPCRAR